MSEGMNIKLFLEDVLTDNICSDELCKPRPAKVGLHQSRSSLLLYAPLSGSHAGPHER